MSIAAEGSPFIDTRMNFSGPIEGRARVDVPDWSRTNMVLEAHDLRLREARPLTESGTLSIDVQGFTLVRHPSRLSPDSDMVVEASSYLEESAAFLREWLGADLVLPQGRGLVKRTNNGGGLGPSRWVHRDYTALAAQKWLSMVEDREGRSLRHYPRFAVLQTWRCLTPPPCDNTLVLCDASSVEARDCIVFDAAIREPYDEPGNVFESQFSRFNPTQRWYYFSDLLPEEMIIFKGFDSDPVRHAQPFHNSIDQPGEGTSPRVSVEARFLAFFA